MGSTVTSLSSVKPFENQCIAAAAAAAAATAVGPCLPKIKCWYMTDSTVTSLESVKPINALLLLLLLLLL
jgi:hypothetical protein